MLRRVLVFLLIAAGGVGLMAASPERASASHSWGDYHWARTSNEFTLPLGDNLTTTEWKCLLGRSGACANYLDGQTVNADWDDSKNTVFNTTIIDGTAGRRCRAVDGTIQVCNDRYGFNGWLGLAQIWTSGSHIVKATAKVNDSYFNTASYNDPMKKQHVLCQEIGHGFGLGHQDESGADLGTCMDYANSFDNRHPNQHDYDQLATIYDPVNGGHLDSSSTVLAAAAIAAARARGVPFTDEGPNDRADFGRAIRFDRQGRPILFERDLGAGARLFTWVVWAR